MENLNHSIIAEVIASILSTQSAPIGTLVSKDVMTEGEWQAGDIVPRPYIPEGTWQAGDTIDYNKLGLMGCVNG